jgi:hypothetical protein
VFLTQVPAGDYIQIKAVDFGKGAKRFEAVVAPLAGGSIALHLDSKDGPLLGTCTVKASDQADGWQTIKTSFKKVKGVHDLVPGLPGRRWRTLHVRLWALPLILTNRLIVLHHLKLINHRLKTLGLLCVTQHSRPRRSTPSYKLTIRPILPPWYTTEVVRLYLSRRRHHRA